MQMKYWKMTVLVNNVTTAQAKACVAATHGTTNITFLY